MTSMSIGKPNRRVRNPRSTGEEALTEWGGYVRSLKGSQGVLHRLKEYSEGQPAQRDPGVFANPLLANLIAEEALGASRAAALDAMIDSYPKVWQTVIHVIYVRGLSVHTAAIEAKASQRTTERILAQALRQAELDWAHLAYLER